MKIRNLMYVAVGLVVCALGVATAGGCEHSHNCQDHKPSATAVADVDAASVFQTTGDAPRAADGKSAKLVRELATAPEETRTCETKGDLETCCAADKGHSGPGTCCTNNSAANTYTCERVICDGSGNCYN